VGCPPGCEGTVFPEGEKEKVLIDFGAIRETVIGNFYGGEKETAAKMFSDGLNNRVMLGRLPPGASIGLHSHEKSSEAVYILQGTGKALYDGEEEALSAGVCHYCPKHHSHSLINNGGEDLLFFAVVAEQ
jgi:mannose-6-phosphate isomerase-like protein (cupin superfamily)